MECCETILEREVSLSLELTAGEYALAANCRSISGTIYQRAFQGDPIISRVSLEK